MKIDDQFKPHGEQVDVVDADARDPFFKPAWAKDAAPAHELAETEMLRAFYHSWEAFHKIPRDKLHRNQIEQASQKLVYHANALRSFYKPVTLLLPSDVH